MCMKLRPIIRIRILFKDKFLYMYIYSSLWAQQPPLLKYKFAFDINPVLDYTLLEPLSLLPLKLLIYKACFLLTYAFLSRKVMLYTWGPPGC